ncbi:hypothetical protein GKE82_24575 [Conexibacter sp. W3-3-2]|uniref:hypothetical protein n=1 Tax=Conexibacter sp. W3-3-2 TaxID=2675227 RepID=UPI0012B937D1|nr:hypothetical protein [Conexibacter sp. W3-3-2]MTD45585.1 hypothetical protein [Conexibacter sp. W3-3-2]MTD47120.1 hypothetical protein [Conexibacter sp. W3-3-2]MTD47384.1 hypothetical protein [Conexibacter sp. W3-3-2]
MSSQPRPDDHLYYEDRTTHLRQGDLFTGVPLGLQLPAEVFNHGNRKFVSGPFEVGFAMLITPSCSMAAQGEPGRYAHPFRTVVPVWPLEDLVVQGAIKEASLGQLRKYDHLANYLYLPAIASAQMPESLALLYAPTTLDHGYLEKQRIAQLSVTAAVHLKRQLARHYGGSLFKHEAFAD